MNAKVLRLVFGVIGNAGGLFLFLSPMVTFQRIIKKRCTEQFSGIPYIMTLLNCLLAAWYGMPFISEDNLMLAAINGIGAVIESIYVLVFLIFAPRKEKAKLWGIVISILAVFSTIALVSSFGLHESKKRKLVCGFASSIFSVIMYASPLSVMRMVMRTKSVEYMPFSLSLFVLICGTSWFVYGLIGRDPFLVVPNGLGSGLGAMQLIIYTIYRSNNGEIKKTSKIESLEMGNIEKNHQEKQKDGLINSGQP